MERTKPSDILRDRHQEIMAVVTRYRAANPRVFGSTARGDDDFGSDLDILVDAAEGTSTFDLAALEMELEDLLGCKVDIHTEGGLAPDVRANALTEARPF